MIERESGFRSPSDLEYYEYMVEELRKTRPAPKPLPDLSKLSEKEKQDFFISLQPPSTQAAMKRQAERTPEEDLAYLLRPIPQEYLAVPDAKSQAELTNERSIKPQEYDSYKSMQRDSKNTLGDSKDSSVNKEKRERGIDAFMYSRPIKGSELTIAEISGIKKHEAIKEIPKANAVIKEEKPKKGYFFQRVIDWITPHQIVNFENGPAEITHTKGWFTSKVRPCKQK